MSNRFKAEFKEETGLTKIDYPLFLYLDRYVSWLETQLEQSRAGEAELVTAAKQVIIMECSYCDIECHPLHCYFYNLKHFLKKYGGTE